MPKKSSTPAPLPLFAEAPFPALTVVHARFIEETAGTLSDLFSGFDTLQALTYSSSVPLIATILPWFRHVDLVFGYEEIVPQDVRQLIALQQAVAEQLKTLMAELAPRQQALAQALREGTITFRTLTHHVSHKKTYLLSGPDRPSRVIVGSANLSTPGLSGRQWENLIVFDDDAAAFAYYYRDWLHAVDAASPVAPQVLLGQEALDLENVPVIRQVIQTQKMVVVEHTDSQAPEAEATRSVVVRATELTASYRDLPLMPAGNGHTVIVPQMVHQIAAAWRGQRAAQAPDSLHVPQFDVNWTGPPRCRFNGHEWSLTPEAEAVRQDVQWLTQYFDGFARFIGSDPGVLQRQYYALLNWLLFAPILPLLRVQALAQGHHGYLYPMTAIVYGKSNAGKTDFLKTVSRLMFGMDVLVPALEFSKSKYRGWAERAQAFPLIVDDIQNRRFHDHAIELIKSTDYFRVLPAPCLVFSANTDIEGLPSEVTKRAYVVPITASIPVAAAAKDRFTALVQSGLSTALYRAYCAQVLPAARTLAAAWDQPEPPDPYQMASTVLYKPIGEALDGHLPPWCQIMTLDTYLTSHDETIRDTLHRLWKTRPDLFVIRRAANHLILTASQPAELKTWKTNIPDYLIVQQAGLSLILHLAETETFLGLRFVRPFLHRVWGRK